MMANIQHHGALTAKLGARHPITTPITQITNHSTWPDHMTGLVGWWRRVERDGESKGNEMMKQTRLLEERAGKQA